MKIEITIESLRESLQEIGAWIENAKDDETIKLTIPPSQVEVEASDFAPFPVPEEYLEKPVEPSQVVGGLKKYCVYFSNYYPREIDSVFNTFEEAEKRADELNDADPEGMEWNVEEV